MAGFYALHEVSAARGASARSAGSARAGGVSRGGRKSVVSSAARVASASPASETAPASDFAGCMDKVCISGRFEEKGRCRCSSQLVRLNKTLRDIDKVQRQVDKEAKELEILMNAVNSEKVNDAIGNIYSNIGSVENRAKMLASQSLDSDLLVMEGLPLYEEGLKQCASWLDKEASSDNRENRKKEYLAMVEKDCAAYTTIVKEKADAASSLLAQTQKNREMFDEQELKKRNLLDPKACYAEYEACVKNECGINFRNCKQRQKAAAAVAVCEALNAGKCEDYKYAVLQDINKLVKSELAKDELAVECQSAYGHLINGKCMFKVLYVADDCKVFSSACDNSAEVWALPGQSFTCDVQSFKNVSSGCGHSCYLIGPNDEKIKQGGNTSGGAGVIESVGWNLSDCVGDSFSTPKAPKGWGKDGYPKNPQYKGVFI
jgi:hypothetical protein